MPCLPKREAQGKDLGDTKDKNGVLFIRELSQEAFKGGGLIFLVIVGAIQFVARNIVKPLEMISREMDTGAATVSPTVTRISASSQTLAEGASEQAAPIEATSSSPEETSSMKKRNADNAYLADSLSVKQRKAKSQPDLTAAAPYRPTMQSKSGNRITGAAKKLPGNGNAKLIPVHGRDMGDSGTDKAHFMARGDLSDFQQRKRSPGVARNLWS